MAAAQQIVPVFNLSFPPSIQLPKLDGTNWQQWSATLGALMRMNGIVVTSPMPPQHMLTPPTQTLML